MDLTPAETAFLAEKVPDGAIIIGYIAIYAWLNPDTGSMEWRSCNDCDFNVAQAIGLLELAKLDMLEIDMQLFTGND